MVTFDPLQPVEQSLFDGQASTHSCCSESSSRGDSNEEAAAPCFAKMVEDLPLAH